MTLDPSIAAAREAYQALELPGPDVLYFLATGCEAFVEPLEGAHEIRLGDLEGTPLPWKEVALHVGRLGSLSVWALDDVGGEPHANANDPLWWPAYPIWLARALGAVLCVHASAGSRLENETPDFAVLTDHIDLSGRSPLIGLGQSRLGPLFPDQSRVHHEPLRPLALKRARALELSADEAIAACLAGPALETPAERRMLRGMGTDLAVQSLAPPLVACAHSGLPALALVAVSGDPEQPDEIVHLVEHATRNAPLLDRWIHALTADLELLVPELRKEIDR